MKRPKLLKQITTLMGNWFTRTPKKQAKPLTLNSNEALAMLNHNDGLVPYDENLLERARTQWQFGDWQSLANIERDSLQHHPDRAKLALLTAAGHMQRGDSSNARKFTQLAQDWGCSKKLISQILIAGVHNSLGRAAAVNGQGQRALQHFESAIAAGAPASELRLLTQARLGEQLGQLGMTTGAAQLAQLKSVNGLSPANDISIKRPPLIFKIKVLAQQSLGEGWASNTVNTVIFRHHGILTSGNCQYTAFYVDEKTLRLIQRNLSTNTIKPYDLLGAYKLRDAHNSISLGIDREGYLHMSYDHHATQLRYRRSTTPYSIAAWTDELTMTGANEDKVTYPTFILPYDKQPLTLLYRDGIHIKGSARLKTYDEASQTWTDHPQAVLSGAEQAPWTSNAYWNHPAVGSDGSLHLSFVWRTHALGEEKRINNINIDYACTFDNGYTWVTSHNRPYSLPITPTNSETVHPVSPGSNLINQSSMALDSHNRPHIVFYSDDPEGIPQYQHLWFDGKVWHHQFISVRKQAFNLQGDGTLQIPISRPEIILDKQDNAYVIYRGDVTDNKMAATLLPAPDYRYQPANIQIICDEALGYAEPIIDHSRWQRDNILTLLLQHNQQPNFDIDHQIINRPVTLLDIQFN
jgi:hypothetical protein